MVQCLSLHSHLSTSFSRFSQAGYLEISRSRSFKRSCVGDDIPRLAGGLESLGRRVDRSGGVNVVDRYTDVITPSLEKAFQDDLPSLHRQPTIDLFEAIVPFLADLKLLSV